MKQIKYLILFLVLVNQSFAQKPAVRYTPSTGAVAEPTNFWDRAHAVASPTMSSHQINVTRTDQVDAITADTTLTLSATPAANTWFYFHLTSVAGPWTITLPAGTWISETKGGTITTMRFRGPSLTCAVRYDGTSYHIFGDPSTGSFTPRKEITGNYTLGTTDPDEAWGGVITVKTNPAVLTLPPAQEGMSFTLIVLSAVAVSIDPDAADLIVRDGVTQADGEKVTSGSAVNDMAVFTYYNATGWLAETNAWTNGG